MSTTLIALLVAAGIWTLCVGYVAALDGVLQWLARKVGWAVAK